ncbi:DUF6010 family protein [Candidatus Nitrotoga arctica]|uniref:Uncharacterized protein n=1 Tax=Candidatus Nitrotoga arctica TaxID=453162 RepID=A0ABM8Z1T6_9PROT|nr:DUF6010 family protein [Candidatus Nitrotoga arctica]CAG9933868.1 conserved membrane protein of unknown function [Candidatus Nitrotoga arctica]
MEYFVGLAIALAVSLSATFIGFDRDRVFYPTIMVVIASYYGLFAVMGGSGKTLLIEFIFIAIFFGVAVLGFKRNLWLIVAALLAHSVFDFFHALVTSNPGVPVWWPMFCLSCDVVLAVYLAWLLKKSMLVASVGKSGG